jgi:hypothetical protein
MTPCDVLLIPASLVGRCRSASSPSGRTSTGASWRRTGLGAALSKDGVCIRVIDLGGRLSSALTRSEAGHQHESDRA